MDTHYHEEFWKLLMELRGQSQYLLLYQMELEKNQNKTNMILAVAASASIGTWAVWQQWPLIWASIIAMSQVVHAIKPFLAWERNLKNVRGARADLEMLYHDAERSWYNVREGNMTTEQIHHLTMDIKTHRLKLDQKHFGANALPLKQDLKDKAYEIVESTIVQGD